LAAALTTATALANDPVSVSVVMEKTVVGVDETQAIALISLVGSTEVETARGPVAMALVIDTSGSMEGQKIRDARSAAHALIDRLSVGDVISIVTYSDSSTTYLANFPISTDRLEAHAAVEMIRATGSTCISCGLERAYALLSDSSTRYTRRTVMLSDGNANRGTTDRDGLRNLANASLESHGVPTSTVGIGFDYNEDLMVAIANGGAGSYYFLPDSDAIASILDREFRELDTVVAGNVIIELTPVGGVSLGNPEGIGGVMHGERLVINVGQLAAGSRRQILVPLNLPSGDLGSVVTARATYLDSDGQGYDHAVTADIERSSDATRVAASTNRDVAVRWEQVESSRQAAEAMAAFQAGRQDAAREQLRRRAEELHRASTIYAAPALEAEARQMEQLYDALSPEAEPTPQEVDGLWLQNEGRARERSRGVDDAEMYHLETVY
jgi:Ca-activated chloride channel family protein